MTFSSQPINDRWIYAQDTAPDDKRDGVMWVDTSTASNDIKTWDAEGNQWVAAAPGNVTIADTAPTGESEGHVWVDTSASPPQVKVLDAGGSWHRQARHADLPVSFANDFTDVTEYTVNHTNGATLVSVTGSGVLIRADIFGASDGAGDYSVSVTIDGATSQSFAPMRYADEVGNQQGHVTIPAVRFDSSLDIVINSGNTGDDQGARAWVVQ